MSGTNFRTVSSEADRAGQAVNQAATSAGAAVRDAAESARDYATDLNRRVSKQADQAVHDLAQRVEDQPITSLLIAGGVGLLAGLLLARR
jgi:ElaB/YqjD/DUF883 family membrane-anchored ribosome-binding protein